jgi:pimeloyl-ACP methyl ester carboxylesterase
MGHPTDTATISLSEQTWSYVGGEYVTRDSGTYFVGGMYVERYVPATVTQAFPIVMFHGGAQSGTNYISTPDGRRGWLHDFLLAGFIVYLVDQPERGRSGHDVVAGAAPKLQRMSVAQVQERFTACARTGLWPQAVRHTGWPGSGVQGDRYFDQFFASQVDMLSDRTEIERLTRDCGVALLDEIGPAIVLTHSQSGPFGWLIADARPGLVKAILSVEPNGPPFRDLKFTGGERWHSYPAEVERPYGIARLPLVFEPALLPGQTLEGSLASPPIDQELAPSYLQHEPARKLPNLAGLKIAIFTAEASYHAPYDHCTSAFLTQAGVAHDFILLHERGLRGDGHMVMLERNNHAVADEMITWLEKALSAECGGASGVA